MDDLSKEKRCDICTLWTKRGNMYFLASGRHVCEYCFDEITDELRTEDELLAEYKQDEV